MHLETLIRSYAVCLLPLDTYLDPTIPLLKKFEGATFWGMESVGIESVQVDAAGWSNGKIRQIDSIYRVGITTYDNDSISRSCKYLSMFAWTISLTKPSFSTIANRLGLLPTMVE